MSAFPLNYQLLQQINTGSHLPPLSEGFDFGTPDQHPYLIPPSHLWPMSDKAFLYNQASYPHPNTSPESETSQSERSLTPDLQTRSPQSATRAHHPNPRNRSPNYIPRPRNAFLIYRSEFWSQQKITGKVEHDHRHISRIIAHCWNGLSTAEKQVWKDKADQEKAAHALKYPGYRFSPAGRGKQKTKRKVNRNTVDEIQRCRRVADLILQGKRGLELESAVKNIGDSLANSDTLSTLPGDSPTATLERCLSASSYPTSSAEIDNRAPPFISPLLPPMETFLSPLPVSAPMLAPDCQVAPSSLFQTSTSYANSQLDSNTTGRLTQNPSHPFVQMNIPFTPKNYSQSFAEIQNRNAQRDTRLPLQTVNMRYAPVCEHTNYLGLPIYFPMDNSTFSVDTLAPLPPADPNAIFDFLLSPDISYPETVSRTDSPWSTP